jgi:2-polyprenyl-3-methyl-5-hydroxy-6-metoxy-1,4-benzoquinol methylase
MRLDDLFHGTRRWLGLGPWSRDYFERRFRGGDPWSYESSEYELTKYRRTLDAIEAIGGRSILEIGCAEGVFTKSLAERYASVFAVDICGRALLRAQRRCAELPGVRFERLDIATTPVLGTYDVVVCAEVLYYLHRRGLYVARDHLVSALEPRGHLVLVNPIKDAGRIEPIVASHPLLRVVGERTFTDHARAYAITLLQKTDASPAGHGSSALETDRSSTS